MDWFVTDHLGSTKLLIDQNGTHKFTGDDDPFGINLRSFGDKDSHRYTGQILDEEQGVYYYGARYYLPEIGRFLATDPAGEFHSQYVYTGNTPINAVDKNGKDTFFVHGTWSKPGEAMRPWYQSAVLKTLDDNTAFNPSWSGGDSREARRAGADSIFPQVLDSLRKGNPVNLVGHSHGGSVIAEITKRLDNYNKDNDTGYKITTVIVMGTPIVPDHQPVLSVAGSYNVVSSASDPVQANGGSDLNVASWKVHLAAILKEGSLSAERGHADRTIPGANNIAIPGEAFSVIPNNAVKPGERSAHGIYLWTQVWDKYIAPSLEVPKPKE